MKFTKETRHVKHWVNENLWRPYFSLVLSNLRETDADIASILHLNLNMKMYKNKNVQQCNVIVCQISGLLRMFNHMEQKSITTT